MKNPNGYGTVVKMKGHRRRPFHVRKTTGWNIKGHPIIKTIGYYATQQEAMQVLADYNKEPWDIDIVGMTMAGLYDLFWEKKGHKLGVSSQGQLKAAYHHCRMLHNKEYREIKAYHMQECVGNCGKGYGTQGTIKNLFYHLDRFALELEIITRNFSDLVTTESAPDESSRKPFTDEEVARLWKIKDYPWADSVLVLLYTGFRISELLSIRLGDVDLEAGTIKKGIKTKAGRGRVVPIHSKIFEIVQRRFSGTDDYLFGVNGHKITYRVYSTFWNRVMNEIEAKHTPHECRHTIRSKMDSVGANKRCIDLIMGHKSKDIGENVYTHKGIEELKLAIELVTY